MQAASGNLLVARHFLLMVDSSGLGVVSASEAMNMLSHGEGPGTDK